MIQGYNKLVSSAVCSQVKKTHATIPYTVWDIPFRWREPMNIDAVADNDEAKHLVLSLTLQDSGAIELRVKVWRNEGRDAETFQNVKTVREVELDCVVKGKLRLRAYATTPMTNKMWISKHIRPSTDFRDNALRIKRLVPKSLCNNAVSLSLGFKASITVLERVTETREEYIFDIPETEPVLMDSVHYRIYTPHLLLGKAIGFGLLPASEYLRALRGGEEEDIMSLDVVLPSIVSLENVLPSGPYSKYKVLWRKTINGVVMVFAAEIGTNKYQSGLFPSSTLAAAKDVDMSDEEESTPVRHLGNSYLTTTHMKPIPIETQDALFPLADGFIDTVPVLVKYIVGGHALVLHYLTVPPTMTLSLLADALTPLFIKGLHEHNSYVSLSDTGPELFAESGKRFKYVKEAPKTGCVRVLVLAVGEHVKRCMLNMPNVVIRRDDQLLVVPLDITGVDLMRLLKTSFNEKRINCVAVRQELKYTILQADKRLADIVKDPHKHVVDVVTIRSFCLESAIARGAPFSLHKLHLYGDADFTILLPVYRMLVDGSALSVIYVEDIRQEFEARVSADPFLIEVRKNDSLLCERHRGTGDRYIDVRDVLLQREQIHVTRTTE